MEPHNRRPLVSIIVCTYNQAERLVAAVDSARAQDFTELEIVVANDASTDATAGVCARWDTDPRVRVIRNPTNLGRVANYRRALYEHARGEWVLMLDGDDKLTDSGFVAAAWRAAHDHPGRDVVVVQAGQRVATDDGAGFDSVPPINSPEKLLTGQQYLRFVLDTGVFSHLASLYHRRRAIEVGFYCAPVSNSDGHSLLRLALTGDVVLLRCVAGTWVQHGDNHSRRLPVSHWAEAVGMYRQVIREADAAGLVSMASMEGAITRFEAEQFGHLLRRSAFGGTITPRDGGRVLAAARRVNPKILARPRLYLPGRSAIRQRTRTALGRPEKPGFIAAPARVQPPRAVLHIGQHKTGSTALQTHLSHSADRLAEQGFAYPRCARTPGTDHALAVSHTRLFWLLRIDVLRRLGRDGDADAELRRVRRLCAPYTSTGQLLAAIDRERRRRDCAVVVLSSENLLDMATTEGVEFDAEVQQAAPQILADLLRRHGYTADVVAYARWQPDLLIAHYAHYVRGPVRADMDFAEFAKRAEPRLDTARLLSPWDAAFPASLRVRPYDAALRLIGIEADFTGHVLGLSADVRPAADGSRAGDRDPRACNRTPSRQFVEFQRLLNRHDRADLELLQSSSVLRAAADWPGTGAAEWLTEDEIRHLDEVHGPGNAEVARLWGGRADGVLFTDTRPEPAAEGGARGHGRSWAGGPVAAAPTGGSALDAETALLMALRALEHQREHPILALPGARKLARRLSGKVGSLDQLLRRITW